MRLWIVSLIAAAALAWGCSSNDTSGLGPGPSGPPRTWRMGFSGFPPSPDTLLAFIALDQWAGRRSDAALMHIDPPWEALIGGFRPDSAVILQHGGIAAFYRAKGLELTVTMDVTNGLDRSSEHPDLVRLGRSIAEPAIQQLYRAYVTALDTLLRPTHLGLAAETNLIRAAAPAPVYAAVVQMTNNAAADIRAHDTNVRLSVSVQVEVAWNRLGSPPSGPPTYGGIAQDIGDFPFAQEFGLSSYPYLGGFTTPENVPLDYYKRVRDEAARPVLVVEGGWPSVPDPPLDSSPGEQARWIRRQASLLDQAAAVAFFQITYTDIAYSLFPSLPPGSLSLFTRIGLVDTLLVAKPARATWDSAFARPRSSM